MSTRGSRSLGIETTVRDERFAEALSVKFRGELGQNSSWPRTLSPLTKPGCCRHNSLWEDRHCCLLISRRSVNTLVLVHRQQLLDQWVEG